jgi:CPA1 family monovalent cation:H+ antiporter
MDVLDFITVLILLATVFLLINKKLFQLPSTIGMMIMALVLSVVITFGDVFSTGFTEGVHNLMVEYDFSKVLFQYMLSFLLFAGALELDLRKLGEEWWTIFILATSGVLISTFVVGVGMYFLLPIIGVQIEFIYTLLFGALISPTDPISVLAMIKKSHVSKNLEAQIAGESMFNDGIGVVVFLTIMHIAQSGVGNGIDFTEITILFGREVIGGLGLGSLIGFLGLRLLIEIDNKDTEIEVLVTLSMVLGGASIASILEVSGPLAMVVIGLFAGHRGRTKKLERAAGPYVYKFWNLIDETMNAILFILIGMQIIVISWSKNSLIAAGIAIIMVLIGRFISVGIPISLQRIRKKVPQYTIRILTWSGLRGGISVALALSLYQNAKAGTMQMETVDLIIVMTYCTALFTIIIQGLTVQKLFRKASKA